MRLSIIAAILVSCASTGAQEPVPPQPTQPKEPDFAKVESRIQELSSEQVRLDLELIGLRRQMFAAKEDSDRRPLELQIVGVRAQLRHIRDERNRIESMLSGEPEGSGPRPGMESPGGDPGRQEEIHALARRVHELAGKARDLEGEEREEAIHSLEQGIEQLLRFHLEQRRQHLDTLRERVQQLQKEMEGAGDRIGEEVQKRLKELLSGKPEPRQPEPPQAPQPPPQPPRER